MLEVGSQPIPGHRLTQRLGAGAFGEVWEAFDPEGKPVALKFMDCRASSPSALSSEIRILRGLSELDHPRFIRMHGVHSTAHHIILSMERADGNLEDLRQVYFEETGKNIPVDHLLELLEQAAEGLDFLAELQLPNVNPASRGLQHCDIKPSNLLLLGEGLKIADFGLCAGTSWHTHRHNSWRGTPPYAAPELFKGQATIGTDQFALCITFLRLAAGDRPFWSSQPVDAPPSGFPVDLTKLRERELPIIVRALHPHADSRWPNCRTFIQALREIAQSCRPPLNLRPRALRPTLQAAAQR
jgi:serine/threonine-protein kinase